MSNNENNKIVSIPELFQITNESINNKTDPVDNEKIFKKQAAAKKRTKMITKVAKNKQRKSISFGGKPTGKKKITSNKKKINDNSIKNNQVVTKTSSALPLPSPPKAIIEPKVNDDHVMNVDNNHENDEHDIPAAVAISAPKTQNKRVKKILEQINENDVIVNLRCDNKKKHTASTSTPSGLRRRPLKAPQDVSMIIKGDNE